MASSGYNSPIPGYGTSLVDRINIYLHFRRRFKVVAQRWPLLALITLVGAGIGLWLALSKPDQFRSGAILGTVPRMVASSSGGNVTTEVAESPETVAAFIQTEQVIKMALQQVQENRGPGNKIARPMAKADAGQGGMYRLTVTATNFEDARQFAIAWANEFINYRKAQRRQRINSSSAQISTMEIRFQQQLDQAQQELEDFEKDNNLIGLSEAGSTAQARLDRETDQFERLKTDLKLFQDATREELASGGVKSAVASEPRAPRATRPTRTGQDDSDDFDPTDQFNARSRYSSLTLQIRGLQRQIEEEQKTLREKHPHLIRLRRELDELEQARKADLELVDAARQGYVRALKAKIERYEPHIKELRDEVFDLTQKREKLLQLQKKVDGYKGQLDDLSRTEHLVTRAGADDDEFNVIESGTGDPARVGPNRPGIVASGAGAGLAAAAVLIFLLHRMDDRLESPEDIETKLEEPVLGQIPDVDKKHYAEGYLLLTRMKSHTMFAEALRGVRSALLLSPDGASRRMLAVTSAVPGDGKTTFTANFAITLANSGAKTLLVDGDMRRGNAHAYFEQPVEGGLSEVLQGRMTVSEALRETGVKNLFFMRAGERPSNPSELLIGPPTKELIQELRASFDFVIFDCPPLTSIDDTFSVAAYLDGTLFVVRAGQTSIRFAKLALNAIHQRGANLIGIIVNGVPIDNPYYYYTTYYYASYYHRPLSDDENIYQDSPKRRGKRPRRVDDGSGLDVRTREAVAAETRGNNGADSEPPAV